MMKPLQDHVDTLKGRPKDERQAVALGTAGAVVALLLVAWAFFFLKGVRDTQFTPASLVVPNDAASEPIVQQDLDPNQIPASDQFGSPSAAQQ